MANLNMGEELNVTQIGEAIQEIRSGKGLTQEALCRRVGISINFLSQVENGRRGVSQGIAERIATALEVPVSFLYLLADRSNNQLVEDLQEGVRESLGLRQAVEIPD